MFKQIRPWLVAHPRWTLTLLVIAALGPFLAKPFNLDDPLFIQLARHVAVQPANPFGFNVNWYGLISPMWTVTENPPLAGYYYALFGMAFGWGEISLHFAGLLASLAVILGTHRLALRLCKEPLLAACSVLTTPVFLVSATTVMCDTLMVAFWIWAVVWWVEGLGENRPLKICAAAFLVSFAVLTKYFGVALIPLLAAYGLIHHRKSGAWLAALLIPLVVLGAYQYYTQALYGHALFSDAVGFVGDAHKKLGFSKPAAACVALSFTGGGILIAMVLAPCLWRGRVFALMIGIAVIAGTFVMQTSQVLQKYPALDAAAHLSVAIQLVCWMVAGMLTLALLAELWHRPCDPGTWLLALWLAGTFAFATIGNWTVNGRTILPMTPAVAILLLRRWEHGGFKWPVVFKTCLAFCGLFALLLAQADSDLAIAARRDAQDVMAKYGQGRETIWFEGHWGFQYYMEELGAHAVDYKNLTSSSGSIMVLPLHNTYTSEPASTSVASRAALSVPASTGLATWQPELGAGFYSSVSGPLPFGFGHVPDESVYIYRLK